MNYTKALITFLVLVLVTILLRQTKKQTTSTPDLSQTAPGRDNSEGTPVFRVAPLPPTSSFIESSAYKVVETKLQGGIAIRTNNRMLVAPVSEIEWRSCEQYPDRICIRFPVGVEVEWDPSRAREFPMAFVALGRYHSVFDRKSSSHSFGKRY